MACPTCGQSWGDKATFCGACGDRLPGAPARSTAPAHDPAPRRDRTHGRWVAAGAVVLVLLVAGAAALVGGSGPARDAGGDDEVAVPDRQDLQEVEGGQAATPPRVACEREGEPVDCVRWMRRLVSANPTRDRHPWWVEVAPGRILARDAETLVALSRSTGDVAWRHELDAREGSGPWSIGDEVVMMQAGQATRALALSDGSERWSQEGTQITFSNQHDRSGTIHTLQIDDDRSVLASRRSDGTVRWRHTIGEIDEPRRRFPHEVTELGPLAFLTLDGPENELVLVALDDRDGTERWRRVDSRPLHVSGGVAVMMDVDRDVQENGGSTTVSESPSDVVGLDVTDGRERWRHDGGGQLQFGIQGDVMVTMGTDGLTGFDTATGEQRWRTATHEDEQLLHPASWWGGPSPPGDSVLSFVPRESLVVARDPATGRTRWRTQLDQLVGHVWRVEGAVIAQADEGTFIHLDPASGDVRGTVTVKSDGQPVLVAGDVLLDPETGWVVGIDLP